MSDTASSAPAAGRPVVPPAHDLFRVLQFEPGNPDRIVPKRYGIGITLNFAHPDVFRWAPAAAVAFSIVIHMLLTASRAVPGAGGGIPGALLFLALSLAAASAAAFAIARAWRARLDPLVVSWGGLLFIVAVSLQGTLNLSYVFLRGGTANLGYADFLWLGLVAGLFQTAARGAFLRLLASPAAPVRPGDRSAALSLGIGFALVELLIIAAGDLAAAFRGLPIAPADALLGAVERLASVLFHVALTVFLAEGIRRGTYRRTLAGAALLHGATDWVAGAIPLLGWPIAAFEAGNFAACLALFLVACRFVRDFPASAPRDAAPSR